MIKRTDRTVNNNITLPSFLNQDKPKLTSRRYPNDQQKIFNQRPSNPKRNSSHFGFEHKQSYQQSKPNIPQMIENKADKKQFLLSKLQNMSCLYTDYLYKSQNKNFIETMTIETIHKKYQQQKKQKLNLIEENQKLKNEIIDLKLNLQTLKFAYRALEIQNHANKSQDHSLNRNNGGINSNNNLLRNEEYLSMQALAHKIANKNSIESDEWGKLWEDASNQNQISQGLATNVNKQSQRDIQLVTKHSQTLCYDDEKNQYLIQVTTQAVRPSIKRPSLFIEEMPIDQMDEVYRQKLERDQILYLLSKNNLQNSQPDVQDFKRTVFEVVGGVDIACQHYQQILPKIQSNKFMTTFQSQSFKDWQLKQNQLKTEISDLYFRQKLLSEQISKLKNIICNQNQEIKETNNQIEYLKQQILLKDTEFDEIKSIIKKVEDKNYYFMKRQEQQKRQMEALKKFSQNLKISDSKIQQFLKEEFGKDDAAMKSTNYQERISYLSYLFKKKEEIYEESVMAHCQKLKEYQYALLLLERKCYQTDRLHDSMLDLMMKGAEQNQKALKKFKAYYNVEQ